MTNTELQVKHTPAPWLDVNNSWDMSTVYGIDDTVIALIPIGDLTCDEDQEKFESVKEANALLIANAPELLEALKMALSIIRVQNGNRHNDTNKAQEIISVAIAKAEGKA